jgi:hypothetical protein
MLTANVIAEDRNSTSQVLHFTLFAKTISQDTRLSMMHNVTYVTAVLWMYVIHPGNHVPVCMELHGNVTTAVLASSVEEGELRPSVDRKALLPTDFKACNVGL